MEVLKLGSPFNIKIVYYCYSSLLFQCDFKRYLVFIVSLTFYYSVKWMTSLPFHRGGNRGTVRWRASAVVLHGGRKPGTHPAPPFVSSRGMGVGFGVFQATVRRLAPDASRVS